MTSVKNCKPTRRTHKQAQQRTSRASQCAQANPPRAVRRCAEPKRAAPRRRHTQKRTAPVTSRADSLKSTRRAPARLGPLRHRCGTRAASLRKGFPGRIEPRASRAPPDPARRKRSECRRGSARAAAASAHTPTARRKCACHAPRRLTPRRSRNRRAAPQARPDARRTLHEPLGPPQQTDWRRRGARLPG